MPKQTNMKKYFKANKIGFNYYGLNGFYEMHKDVCEKEDDIWDGELKVLNDLSYAEFTLLCNDYHKELKVNG